METLPALKITHFNGEPARGQVYAYLRCYVRDGEIPFSVTVFDETPPDTARFGFAVTPDDAAGTYLFASCTKQQGDALWLYRTGEPADVPLRRLEMPPMRHLAGSDEQGFYWSAEGVLPAQAFRTAFGRVPRVGGILPGNAFLYDVSEPAFGAAFPVPAGAGVPTAARVRHLRRGALLTGACPFAVFPFFTAASPYSASAGKCRHINCRRRIAMFKFILKVFAVAAAVAAALAALSWFDKAGTPEYIEIYSDDEDAF